MDSRHGGEVGLYFIRYKHFLECEQNTPSDSPSRRAAASPASSVLCLPPVTDAVLILPARFLVFLPVQKNKIFEDRRQGRFSGVQVV